MIDLINFFLYSLFLAVLFIFSGIGLTLVLCPDPLKKYCLVLSPFIGLSYVSFISWLLIFYIPLYSSFLFWFILIPPLLLIIIAILINKNNYSAFFQLLRFDYPQLVMLSSIFLVVSVPYFFIVSKLNTISFGNNDIAHYAAISKYILWNFFSGGLPDADINAITMFSDFVTKNYFGGYISTAIPCKILGIEPFLLQNLIMYVFYIFLLATIFLFVTEIYKMKRPLAIICTICVGMNFNLLFILYQGFLGQILGMGMMFALFFILIYPIQNTSNYTKCYALLPLAIILFYGLLMTYFPLIPFIIGPWILFIFIMYYFNRNFSQLKFLIFFLSCMVAGGIFLSPDAGIIRIREIADFTNAAVGWAMPFTSPELAIGVAISMVVKINTLLIVVISIPVMIIWGLSLRTLYFKQKEMFWFSLLLLVFIYAFIGYFFIKEMISPCSFLESYKAFKLYSYFIPFIVMLFFIYFNDLDLSKFNLKSRINIKSIVFIISVLLIIGSGIGFIYYTSTHSLQVKETIIDLKTNPELSDIHSLNVAVAEYWDQMWIYYFLYPDKQLYLEYQTYYPPSPSKADWTLINMHSDDYRHYLLNNSIQIKILNPDYAIVKRII